MNLAERWIIGCLAGLGLVMFFFPIVTLKVPIAGAQSRTGYDVIFASDIGDVTHKVGATDESAADPSKGRSETVPTPLSVSLAPLMGLLVAVAFIAAALTLFGAFRSRRLARLASGIGAGAALLATIHIKVLNSDIHRMLRDQMASVGSQDDENPFAGLAKGLGNLLAEAFSINPGLGLYVLVLSLAAALVLLNARFLARATTPVPAQEHVDATT